jgi:hypothetical protein
MSNKKQWILIADQHYNSIEEVYKNYKKKVTMSYSDIEQEWVDNNLQIIMDFMGDEDVWKYMIPNIELYGIGGRASYRNLDSSTKKSTAIFSGSHWKSRKPDDTIWFDPYDAYQVYGTNQFCQTFAMMYLLNKLPPVEHHEDDKENNLKNNFKKYYKYTHEALLFIYDTITHVPFNTEVELKAIQNCLKHPNLCLNAIELI